MLKTTESGPLKSEDWVNIVLFLKVHISFLFDLEHICYFQTFPCKNVENYHIFSEKLRSPCNPFTSAVTQLPMTMSSQVLSNDIFQSCAEGH